MTLDGGAGRRPAEGLDVPVSPVGGGRSESRRRRVAIVAVAAYWAGPLLGCDAPCMIDFDASFVPDPSVHDLRATDTRLNAVVIQPDSQRLVLVWSARAKVGRPYDEPHFANMRWTIG